MNRGGLGIGGRALKTSIRGTHHNAEVSFERVAVAATATLSFRVQRLRGKRMYITFLNFNAIWSLFEPLFLQAPCGRFVFRRARLTCSGPGSSNVGGGVESAF